MKWSGVGGTERSGNQGDRAAEQSLLVTRSYIHEGIVIEAMSPVEPAVGLGSSQCDARLWTTLPLATG